LRPRPESTAQEKRLSGLSAPPDGKLPSTVSRPGRGQDAPVAGDPDAGADAAVLDAGARIGCRGEREEQ
jgi:hypothetical protein